MCVACVLCIVPLAISQTHQGATISHAVFVFPVFCLWGCGDLISDSSASSVYCIKNLIHQHSEIPADLEE
jgi:hypothetical protein